MKEEELTEEERKKLLKQLGNRGALEKIFYCPECGMNIGNI